MIFKVRVTTADGQQVPVRVRANSEAMARGLAMQQFPGLANANFVILGTLGEDEQTNIPLIGGQTGPLSPGVRDIQDAFSGGSSRDGGTGSAGDPVGALGQARTLDERESALPQAAIRSFLEGQGLPTRGIVGGALGNAARFAPDVLDLRQAQAGQESGGLSHFLQQAIGGGQGITRGIGGQAQDTLRSLAGLSPDAAGQFSPELQPFLSPTGENTEALGSMLNIGQAALAGRTPFFGSRWGNQVSDELQRRFGDLAFQEQQPGNLAEFIRQQLRF
jgi:hypothetical protein